MAFFWQSDDRASGEEKMRPYLALFGTASVGGGIYFEFYFYCPSSFDLCGRSLDAGKGSERKLN